MRKIIVGVILGVIILVLGLSLINWYKNSTSLNTRITQSDKVFMTIGGTRKEITDKRHIEELKEIFGSLEPKHLSFGMVPSCPFSENDTVEFYNSNNGKSIVVCPAFDGCAIYQLNGKYYKTARILKDDFEEIALEYGAVFV